MAGAEESAQRRFGRALAQPVQMAGLGAVGAAGLGTIVALPFLCVAMGVVGGALVGWWAGRRQADARTGRDVPDATTARAIREVEQERQLVELRGAKVSDV